MFVRRREVGEINRSKAAEKNPVAFDFGLIANQFLVKSSLKTADFCRLRSFTKLIPVYQIYTPRGRSLCSYEGKICNSAKVR